MWIDDLPAYLVALSPARLILWPALGGASATLAVAFRDGRRRTALNECLHELRRPLQTLALLADRGEARGEGSDGDSVEMAAVALARLEREINGGGDDPSGPRQTFAARPLLEATCRRWRAQARMRGKSLALRWDAEEAAVEGDRIALAGALDNLLANALEHGGQRIELSADRSGDRICLAVVDSGSGAGRRARERDTDLRGREARRRRDPRSAAGRLPGRRRRDPRSPLANFSGRARHGHGLRLVRRTAARHGGAFALHEGEQGTSAVLELPLASSRWAEPAPAEEVTSAVTATGNPLPTNLDAPAPRTRRRGIVVRKVAR